MKFVTGLALFVIFSFAAGWAWAFALVGLLMFGTHYAANVMHSMDMLLAAMLGWSGQATVSKECGRELVYELRPCRFCRIVCKILDVVLEPGHCRKEGAK